MAFFSKHQGTIFFFSFLIAMTLLLSLLQDVARETLPSSSAAVSIGVFQQALAITIAVLLFIVTVTAGRRLQARRREATAWYPFVSRGLELGTVEAYVQAARAKGYRSQQIEQELRDAGWDHAVIDRLLQKKRGR